MYEFELVAYFKPNHEAEDQILERFYKQFDQDHSNLAPDFDQNMQLKNIITIDGLHRAGRMVWLFRYREEIIGFVTFTPTNANYRDCVFINDFFIDVPYRHQGLGKKFLEIVQARIFHHYPYCRRIGLTVFKSNISAMNLYKNAGFKTDLELLLLDRDPPTG